ncbi:hypothetical protein K503DRAFT_40779 [Rhizopogon vinicolor AM-OR11-026]|uniref:Uncharacterized protein n=1 Tax=Rhizopogon vinicolor AM-OR11-026 TaxID=1314800 RepID=A0A1B7MGZ2_9AGAM|nr:hypothetical protein K503DRAFT_40779 [Rhizopogon vinicolor AM-OR11-026]
MNTIPITIPDPGNCILLGGRNNVFEFRKYKNAVGPIQKTYFEDTTKYMVYIMIMSSFSIIMTMAPPITWVAITNSPQIVMHSVLASRILFNLRESEGRSNRYSVSRWSALDLDI